MATLLVYAEARSPPCADAAWGSRIIMVYRNATLRSIRSSAAQVAIEPPGSRQRGKGSEPGAPAGARSGRNGRSIGALERWDPATPSLSLRTERNSSDRAVLDQPNSPFRRTVGEVRHVDVVAETRHPPE